MGEYHWVIWLGAMVIFGIAEAATVSMVSLWFVGGALAAMIAALLGGGIWIQVAVFLAVSAVLLACLRPFVRKFVTPRKTATNTETLIGQQALITQKVDNLLGTGALKLEGKEWTVRSADGANIPEGTLVRVVKIEGVKLFVQAVEAAVSV